MPTVHMTPQSSSYPQQLHVDLGQDAPELTVEANEVDALAWLNSATPRIAIFSSVKVAGNLLLRVHDLAQSWRAHPLTIISGFHAPAEAVPCCPSSCR